MSRSPFDGCHTQAYEHEGQVKASPRPRKAGEMDEPEKKPGAYLWLLSILYGRGLIGTATKLIYWVMALSSVSIAWWFLTADAEATGISISKRILISAFFVVLTVAWIAMVRSVDQLPPDDKDD